MLITRDSNESDYIIRSYEPGKININNTIFIRSVIVSAKQLIDNWQPQHFSQLQSQHFEPILAMKPEIVLLGTGERQQFPAIEVLLPFINQKIGIEVMDSSAACRTFAILTAEARNVVAALLIT